MTENMQRRRLLAGLAAGGVTLLAGCSGGNGSNGNNSSGNGGSGNNTTQASTDDGNGGGGDETSSTATDSTTVAATTMAATAQQTAQMATTTPSSTAVSNPTTGEQTMAPMTTGSSPSTAAPVGTGTTGPGTSIGSVEVNISKLKTYSGDSFSIKRPAGWEAISESSKRTTFQSQSGIGVLMVIQIPVPSSASTDQLVSSFMQGYQKGTNGTDASAKTLNKQTITLSNGNSAKVVSTQLNTGSVNVRQEILITIVNGTAYIAAMTVPGKSYSSISKQIEKILLSLTIKSSSNSSSSGSSS